MSIWIVNNTEDIMHLQWKAIKDALQMHKGKNGTSMKNKTCLFEVYANIFSDYIVLLIYLYCFLVMQYTCGKEICSKEWFARV